MSSDSSDGEEFVAGTPAKSRLLLPARCTNDGGRFARASSSVAQRTEARAVLPLSAPATGAPLANTGSASQRVAALSAGFAAAAPRPAALSQQPLAGRFSAPSLAPPAAQWAGQGASLLQRGAGGFSRIAQERQKAHNGQLETPAPPHLSGPSVSAAAAAGGGMLASVLVLQRRVEARCAHMRAHLVLASTADAPFAAALQPPQLLSLLTGQHGALRRSGRRLEELPARIGRQRSVLVPVQLHVPPRLAPEPLAITLCVSSLAKQAAVKAQAAASS